MDTGKTKYGLRQVDTNRIITVLSKNKKINRVILFGSRAKGNYRNGSDVDLCLKGENLELNDVLDLSIEIDDLLLPYKFDLVIYERIKENALKEHIKRVGVTLYQRS